MGGMRERPVLETVVVVVEGARREIKGKEEERSLLGFELGLSLCMW